MFSSPASELLAVLPLSPPVGTSKQKHEYETSNRIKDQQNQRTKLHVLAVWFQRRRKPNCTHIARTYTPTSTVSGKLPSPPPPHTHTPPWPRRSERRGDRTDRRLPLGTQPAGAAAGTGRPIWVTAAGAGHRVRRLPVPTERRRTDGGRTDGRMDGWTDGRMDGRTDGRTDGRRR